LHSGQEDGHHGQARPEAHLHQLRGAGKPLNPDGDPPVHPAHDAFSKKVENHEAAVALYFMWYNFGRVH